MREIKFRAWDKSNKRFVRSVLEDRIPTSNTREGLRLKTKLTLCQFIGLKDKHKSPIYVGDILEWKYRGVSNVFRAEVVTGFFEIGRDSWDMPHHSCGFALRFNDGAISGFASDEKYSIVGNVFETPELLKP